MPAGGTPGGGGMRARASKDGLTVRAIAGTYNVLLALDLADAKRAGCLGFTIERTDLDTGDRRWLPNLLRFPADVAANPTTARAPLQKFRWGDYTAEPGRRYRYRVLARYGAAADVVAQGLLAEKPNAFDLLPGGVTVEVVTEDNRKPGAAVFFNRGAAASEAYVRRYGDNDPAKIPDALVWLSRGLEEALVAFMAQAADGDYALHGAVYEFQKPNLLKALAQAQARGAEVAVVYHARVKGVKDHTRDKNLAAIAAAGLTVTLYPRTKNNSTIMHDKFLVLLKKDAAGTLQPQAVWTGSTNWTEGAIYGQLNVGHAFYDAALAAKYEALFQALKTDPADVRDQIAALTPVPKPAKAASIPHGTSAIFSPQKKIDMIELYADVCAQAKVLMVCAPFALHPDIRKAFNTNPEGGLRFLLGDKEGSFGGKGQIDIIQRDPGTVPVVATILKSALNDFQGKLLSEESFHHAGVHIHSKIILADPFGTDPILIMGSANFSTNSTEVNDSNSLLVRGDTAVVDIYATEFMRMFEHYWFRYKQSQATGAGKPLALKTDASWADPYYVAGSYEMRDRLAFAGL
jgi:phosphatidylserine/phosphatidylglycerophosphate/cardiolipin synthase-like enzyme